MEALLGGCYLHIVFGCLSGLLFSVLCSVNANERKSSQNQD